MIVPPKEDPPMKAIAALFMLVASWFVLAGVIASLST
jgi:hypothetical protein